MKINIVTSAMAIIASALIAYGFYSFCHTQELREPISVCTFFMVGLPLVMLIGVQSERHIATINIRVLSAVFFVIGLAVALLFSFINFAPQAYIIANGLIMLIYLFFIYSVVKVRI